MKSGHRSLGHRALGKKNEENESVKCLAFSATRKALLLTVSWRLIITSKNGRQRRSISGRGRGAHSSRECFGAKRYKEHQRGDITNISDEHITNISYEIANINEWEPTWTNIPLHTYIRTHIRTYMHTPTHQHKARVSADHSIAAWHVFVSGKSASRQ